MKFLDKLKAIGIDPLVYSRLKDNILIALESIEKGSNYENGKLVIDESKILEDENKTKAKITMEMMRDVAESVDSMLKFTFDVVMKKSKCQH